MNAKLLIIGGTGLVGKRIVEMLTVHVSTAEVYIGSRKARPNDKRFLKIDVSEPESLACIASHGITLVVLCAPDPDNHVIQYCIRHTIGYIDITKPTPELTAAHQLAISQSVNSPIVFSSGWMGGIVGSMASYLEEKFDSVRLSIYYSLNDLAGESTTHFIAENVTKPFDKYRHGKTVATKHFLQPEQHVFDFGVGQKTTYDFDIPELFIFHRMGGIPTVAVKMTYDSDVVSRLLYWLQKIRFFNVVPYSVKRKLFSASGKGDRIVFEVVVNNGSAESKISLEDTEGQSHLTAFLTVMHIRKLIQVPKKGVFFSHQLHQPEDVIAELSAQPQIEIKVADYA